jgi:hypothetical protein
VREKWPLPGVEIDFIVSDWSRIPKETILNTSDFTTKRLSIVVAGSAPPPPLMRAATLPKAVDTGVKQCSFAIPGKGTCTWQFPHGSTVLTAKTKVAQTCQVDVELVTLLLRDKPLVDACLLDRLHLTKHEIVVEITKA